MPILDPVPPRARKPVQHRRRAVEQPDLGGARLEHLELDGVALMRRGRGRLEAGAALEIEARAQESVLDVADLARRAGPGELVVDFRHTGGSGRRVERAERLAWGRCPWAFPGADRRTEPLVVGPQRWELGTTEARGCSSRGPQILVSDLRLSTETRH